jgi:hypothetical protein
VLQQVAPALAAQVAEARLWSFAGRKGFLRQASGPGWAVVGDAGYFKDPLIAHGSTDALRDPEPLADAAAAGTSAATARYAAVRDDKPICSLRTTMRNARGEICLSGTAATFTVPLRHDA